jgi:hypothetical protein
MYLLWLLGCCCCRAKTEALDATQSFAECSRRKYESLQAESKMDLTAMDRATSYITGGHAHVCIVLL